MEHKHEMTTRAIVVRYLRRKWRTPVQVIGGVGVLALVVGFAPHRHREASAADQPPVLRAGAEVRSLRSTGVGSSFEGVLGQVAVHAGQAVKRGDLLFRMDPMPIKVALAGARENQSIAAASLRQTRADRAADLRDLERDIRTLKQELAQEEARGQAAERARVQETGSEEDRVFLADDAAAPDQVDQAAAEAFDPGRLMQIRQQLADTRSVWAERARAWEPGLRGAAETLAEAEKQVRTLEAYLAQTERRSPIDGVVTAVFTAPGGTVHAGSPVVRVDDPSAYRVVTLVDQKAREGLTPGATVSVVRDNTVATGRLEKIVDGCDSEALHYWLWVKPTNPQQFQPGQGVDVRVQPEGLAVAGQ